MNKVSGFRFRRSGEGKKLQVSPVTSASRPRVSPTRANLGHPGKTKRNTIRRSSKGGEPASSFKLSFRGSSFRASAGSLFFLQFAVDLAFAEAHFLGHAFHGLALVEFFLLHQVVDAGSGVFLFDGGLTLLLCLADEQSYFAANLLARLELGEGLGGFERRNSSWSLVTSRAMTTWRCGPRTSTKSSRAATMRWGAS